MAKNFAKKKKGSIAIWQIFEIILFAALVYTFITLWPVFLQKQNVDYIAKTMVRAVETNGRIDSSITDLQHELENDFGVELDDVRWTTQYVPGTNKIQIKSKFELTVTDHATILVAYVMPSHQYPTGAVMTIGRRAELLRWAEREPDRYLIEDDYDSEFRYRGKPIPSLQSSDEKGKVIYIGTFSKAIAPAIRVSYMVLPGDLLDIYRRDCSFYSCTVSRIDQRILNEFIRDGYFERHLNKMRMRYRAKHDLLLAGLEPFKKQFVISGEDAGLHLLLTAKGNVTEQELLERAAAEKVKAYGMSENMVEATMRKATVLLGFGSIDEAEMQEGLRRLQKAWL